MTHAHKSNVLLEADIRQMLYNWVLTLQIDGATGESIVTREDVDNLAHELTETIHRVTEHQCGGGILSLGQHNINHLE